jgi:hypothetical protein
VELPYGEPNPSDSNGYYYEIIWGETKFASKIYSFEKEYETDAAETLEFNIYNNSKTDPICTINKTVLIQIVDEVTY